MRSSRTRASGPTCPKILFAGRFRDVELRSATSRRGFGDRRDLGVFLSGARVDGVDVWSRVQLVDGTWGLEPDAAAGGEWTGTVTHLRVPSRREHAATVSFLLAADGPRAVSLRAGGDAVEHTVGIDPAWFDVAATGDGIDVINNVGTELLPGGFGVDRGFLEPDDGQFDEPAEVFAWCGAGVLLRRAYLDDVGLFDEDFFVYYEDLELAWRGTDAAGGTAPYRPRSSVTSTPPPADAARGSSSTTTNATASSSSPATARPARRRMAALRSLRVSASYTARDVVAPVVRR